MASPLSPAPNTVLNASTPLTAKRNDSNGDYEVQAFTVHTDSPDGDEDSSPFLSCVNDKSTVDQENVSPYKPNHSRVRSGTELSPLKILSEQRPPEGDSMANGATMAPPPLPRSPRKMSPEKRFPVKVSNPLSEAPQAATNGQTISLDDAMKENAGLTHAIEIFEDERSMLDAEDDTTPPMNVEHDNEAAGPDDTMISTFSTFSAVPDMTMFAKFGQSPNKVSQVGGTTPRAKREPSPSETPRPASKRESGSTTNLLMDFTEQLRHPQRSPAKQGNLTYSRTSPNVAATPNRRYSNLLDFDIPPMPTPRSVPSITPRELESLKSNFLSEISSLKASLSGKEAEVQSLKTAVGDAEKRVGESLEQLREEQLAKEQLAAEKEDWESRGREMESVLQKVKEDIVTGQREREELEQKLDESEKRREAADMLHQEAESKMAGMRAGRDSDKSSAEKPKSPGDAPNREVEVAVERVARELHGLYKSKHETKVAALKKSYESRWQKKVKELESRIEELRDENQTLRSGADTTLARIESGSAEAGDLKAQTVKDSAAIKELNADIQRLEAVVSTVQRDNTDLRGMLERERVEKGELVQLAEEMMSMQSVVGSQQPQEQPQPQPQQPQPREQQQPHPEAPATKTPKTSHEGLRGSVGPRSGLRAPGTALRAPHERNKSAGGLPRPGGVARGGIMSSIEKMGSYRGRGAAE